MALQIGPDGSLVAPHWDVYDIGNLPPVQIAPRAKNINVISPQQHSTLMTQRQAFMQQQQQQQQPQQQGLPVAYQDAAQPSSQYLFGASSSMPTISAPDMGMVSPPHQSQTASSPGHLQASCSPEMSIKTSPIEPQLSWSKSLPPSIDRSHSSFKDSHPSLPFQNLHALGPFFVVVHCFLFTRTVMAVLLLAEQPTRPLAHLRKSCLLQTAFGSSSLSLNKCTIPPSSQSACLRIGIHLTGIPFCFF